MQILVHTRHRYLRTMDVSATDVSVTLRLSSYSHPARSAMHWFVSRLELGHSENVVERHLVYQCKRILAGKQPLQAAQGERDKDVWQRDVKVSPHRPTHWLVVLPNDLILAAWVDERALPGLFT